MDGSDANATQEKAKCSKKRGEKWCEKRSEDETEEVKAEAERPLLQVC